MLFIHKNNLENKIKRDYKGLKDTIKDFYESSYMPVHNQLMAIDFSDASEDSIKKATQIFNDYYLKLKAFSAKYGIKSQSKFESTFLEEMSCYLFKDLKELKDGSLGVYNKHIFAGLKIDSDENVKIIKKDVDFCIGKEIKMSIESKKPISLVLPIVAVEVKTFLDATMFGEVKSSSRAIKNASPNAKTYVLMGYRNIADTHIVAARNDSALNELFALRENATDPMHADVLTDYWKEITKAVQSAFCETPVKKIGRLLKE